MLVGKKYACMKIYTDSNEVSEELSVNSSPRYSAPNAVMLFPLRLSYVNRYIKKRTEVRPVIKRKLTK